MTVKDIVSDSIIIKTDESGIDNEVTSVYCCDLLSLVMGRAPANSAWVTVIANVNIVAVAVLAEISCIVIAENIRIDDETLQKAKDNNIAILSTTLPVFDAANKINKML